MPTFKKRKRPGRRGYSDVDLDHLLVGKDYFSSFGHGADFDEPDFRIAWGNLQVSLLLEWITKYPRTRPFAWWIYNAPERRRRINASQAKTAWPESAPRYRADTRHLLDATLSMSSSCEDAEYETQAAYLERLGLLTENE